MFASNPGAKPLSRKLCAHCEATPGGCRGLAFVSGRHCCPRCTGDHETPTDDTAPGDLQAAGAVSTTTTERTHP